MPGGWKKNVPKSTISNYERCGGSRHHKKGHGNSNRRTCTCCSWNGNDKSITKQKGCLKVKQQNQGQTLVYHNYEEVQEGEGLEDHCATWTTCLGQLPAVPKTNIDLYDKRLSDYISDELFNHSRRSSESGSGSESEASGDASGGGTSSDDDCDDDWEFVSVEESIISS